MQKQKMNPDDAYRTLLVIWIALFVSQFLFVLLALTVKPELRRFDLTRPLYGENAAAVIAISAISLINFALSFMRRNKFLARSVAEQDIGLVQTAMIAGCALAESISLFGVVLALFFDYQWFFLFSGLGILTTLLHLPRRSDIAAASFRM